MLLQSWTENTQQDTEYLGSRLIDVPQCDKFPSDVPLTGCEGNANTVIARYMIDITDDLQSLGT